MKRLKELREGKRISQQKLAIDLNISQASISKYEIGSAEPDINSIIRISDYFGVTTDYLLGNSAVKFPLSQSDLSEEEVNLLADYRKLDSLRKQKISAYLKGLSESVS